MSLLQKVSPAYRCIQCDTMVNVPEDKYLQLGPLMGTSTCSSSRSCEGRTADQAFRSVYTTPAALEQRVSDVRPTLGREHLPTESSCVYTRILSTSISNSGSKPFGNYGPCNMVTGEPCSPAFRSPCSAATPKDVSLQDGVPSPHHPDHLATYTSSDQSLSSTALRYQTLLDVPYQQSMRELARPLAYTHEDTTFSESTLNSCGHAQTEQRLPLPTSNDMERSPRILPRPAPSPRSIEPRLLQDKMAIASIMSQTDTFR
jgi:hypothetical protein